MINWLRLRWQSLIFRLLFYFLVSMLALSLVLVASFAKRFKPHVENEILPNVERYIEYLIEDIGHPPDLQVAAQLTRNLPFELRIEGEGLDWTSSTSIAAISQYDFRPAPLPYRDVFLGHRRDQEFLLVKRQDYQYLFAVDSSFRRGAERRHWLLFIALGSILLILYLGIRKLFKPLETMSEQIRQIGDGDLSQGNPIRAQGELGLLAQGIDRMSGQIKTMLESKSGLLLAISHELRSPITRMRVNLELLESDQLQQRLVQDLQEMDALVGAILESERLSVDHAPLILEECDLKQLISEVVEAHPCRDRISTELAAVKLDLDSLRVKLMLKNLLDNAGHYSANQADMIEIRLFEDRGSAIIEVRDHGLGIPREELPRLTEAFYRPDSSRQRGTGGYGLGLYLCNLIVTAHGGSLTIESEPGEGTNVRVNLPLDNS